jgi:SH3 domain protein
MRQGPLSLLFAASLLMIATAHAEETPAAADVSSAVSTAQAQLDSLEQRLAESERQRAELNTQLQSSAEVRENAVIGRLRQENQRLKLQFKEAQAKQDPPMLNEEQTWFSLGGITVLLAMLCGSLLTGGRRKSRREWIN